MQSEKPAAVPSLQSENERVRVTKWSFAPGAATGWHRHEYDYVVVPLTSGRLRLTHAGESVEAELIMGQSYWRKAGVEHDVENINDFDFAFVEVEVK